MLRGLGIPSGDPWYWGSLSGSKGLGTLGSGVLGSPLRVGLVMLVPVVLDHSVAAYADVWARDLHPSQGDPGDGDRRTGAGTRKGKAPRPLCCTLSHPVCSPPSPYSPVEDVVILTTPAPVLIGEAIDSQKLGFTQARHASKVASIGQPMAWEGMRQ